MAKAITAATAATDPHVTSRRLDLLRRVAAARLRPGLRSLRGSGPLGGGTGSASTVLVGLRAGRSGSMPPGIAHGGRSDSGSVPGANTCQPLLRDSWAVRGRPGLPA